MRPVSLLALALLAPALAQPPAAGLGAGVLAGHVGSGEHRLAPALNAWARFPLGGACYLEPAALLARRAEPSAAATFQERWSRAELGLGCATGTRAVQVAGALGPALTWRHTNLDTGQDWQADVLAPGLRWRGGFLIPLGSRIELDLLAGGATAGRVVDFDLLLHGGVRW
ncbi:MAG: hypothetical protein ABIO70_21440 [Pseudomonadota bacterium]